LTDKKDISIIKQDEKTGEIITRASGISLKKKN